MPRSTSHSVALIAARYELVRKLRADTETIDWEAFDTALDRRVVVQLLLLQDPLAIERFWHEQSGEWTHIRGSDGRAGWVLTVTLAP